MGKVKGKGEFSLSLSPSLLPHHLLPTTASKNKKKSVSQTQRFMFSLDQVL